MFLNADNTKIINYLKSNNLMDYANSYHELLATGQKIDKKELKIILKFVRLDNSPGLSNKLLEIFKIFKIDFTDLSKKDTVSISSNQRVKQYRKKLKDKGYKNISIFLSPADYKKLKTLRISENKPYSQIISYLLSDK